MFPSDHDFDNEFEQTGDAARQLPIFQKGQEIFHLTLKIAELIDEEDEDLSLIKPLMMEDAAQLTVKVMGAEGGSLYDIRMENATLIRKAARALLTHCTSLEMFGFQDGQYLGLLREAIEEYRLLFLDWIKSFDQWDYTIDRWGLFNPPGTTAEDVDPDDALPPETDA